MSLAALRQSLAGALAALVASAAFGADETVPERLACRGNEPFWSLKVDGASASYATPEAPEAQSLRGKLAKADHVRPAFVVFRGSAAGEGVVVAFVSREACADSMSDERFDFRARLSMPDGTIRLGCCRPDEAAVATAPPAVAPAPLPVPAPAPSLAPASVRPQAEPAAAAPAPAPAPGPAPGPAPAPGTAMVTGLALENGTVCRSSGRGATLAFAGRRLNFACPPSPDGVRVALLGPIVADGAGLEITRGAIVHDGDRFVVKEPAPVSVTLAEITLADGQLCVAAAKDSTLAFDGERVSFRCGVSGLAERVLLGEPAMVEGSFVLFQALAGPGELGYVLRDRERLIVSSPR